jgi:CBS domain containing-hemolysin-like protein
MPLVWLLLATVFFVLLNGFFVAAEFALVKVRGSRLESLAQGGNSRAQVAVGILGGLDRYLSACQLGITLASLILGWLAEPAVARLIIAIAGYAGVTIPDTGALHVVALAIALAIVTILHMTVGEQAPKIWAIQRPEPMTLWVAYPLKIFTMVFRPFIWIINSISNALLRLVGIRGIHVEEGAHDIEELRAVLHAAARAGHITIRQRVFGEGVLGLMDLQVRHIMLPREELSFLSTSMTMEENLRVLRETRHTRFPLCDPDMENVKGLIHAKDVLARLIQKESPDLKGLVREMPRVESTHSLGRLILEMQRDQTHCALVVDEEEKAVGMVFLEDALEEIVGPLHDEFDRKVPWITRPEVGVVEMTGSVPLREAQEVLGADLGKQEDTIGGRIGALLGRVPAEGDTVEIPPYRVTVLAMSRRRIGRARFERISPPPPPR